MTRIHYYDDEGMWEIDDHDYELKIWKDGSVKGSLGNFTDTGWFWDFDGNWGLLSAIARMPENMRNKFFDLLESEIPFSVFKKAIEKSIKEDGVKELAYHIAGDNVAFRFGQGFADSGDLDYEIRSAVEEISEDDCIRRKYGEKFIEWLKDHYDDVWIYYGGEDEDAVVKNVSHIIKPYVQALVEAVNYEEIMEIFEDELTIKNEDIFDDVDEIWMEEKTDSLIEAEYEWTKEHEDELKEFGIETRHINGSIWPLPIDEAFEMKHRLCEEE